jgi:hypothetical protein
MVSEVAAVALGMECDAAKIENRLTTPTTSKDKPRATDRALFPALELSKSNLTSWRRFRQRTEQVLASRLALNDSLQMIHFLTAIFV